MAHIVNHHNHLQEQHKSMNKKATLWGILTLLSFGTFFLIGPFAIIAVAITGSLASRYSKQNKILSVGLQGEQSTINLIQNLPDSYVGINNIKIQVEGKTSELDCIVVGPNGVFVVETKNLNGVIEGKLEDRMWMQHKTGRKGGEYSKEFYSPAKQVGTHVYRLATYLRQNNINVWVQGVVYFANPEAEVQVDTGTQSKIPVFSYQEGGSRDLLNYLHQSEVNNPLTPEVQKQIVELLAA